MRDGGRVEARGAPEGEILTVCYISVVKRSRSEWRKGEGDGEEIKGRDIK